MVNQQQKYNSVGNYFDYVSGIFERKIINKAVDSLDIKNTDSFLDLACGTGKVLKYASKKTKHLYACDFSKKMIDVAKKRLQKSKIGAKIEICDITKKLPYKTNSIDKINFSVTLGMIDPKDYKIMLSEIKRVLRKDGLLAVTEYTIKKRNIFTSLLLWENKVMPKFQDCKPVNVEETLKQNGFEIINSKIKNCFGFKFEVVLAKKNQRLL